MTLTTTTAVVPSSQRTRAAEVGVRYAIYRGCTDLPGLKESISWEQVAAFDPPPG